MSSPCLINRVVRRVRRRYGPWQQQYPPGKEDRTPQILGSLSVCGSGRLGAKQHHCDRCGSQRVTLNTCGDRHCTRCARQSRYLWYRDVMDWSLGCDYLHIVTTLPHEPNDLVAANPGRLLRLLFRCTKEVLLEMIGQRYGCVPGLILVLHTWGQRLNLHFHIHVVMTAGGLSKDGQWIAIDQDELEAASAEIARRFKKKYLRGLRKALRHEQLELPPSLPNAEAVEEMMATITRKDWVANVGATPQKYRDSGDRRKSLGYVGKYVAGTAIGDGRIISYENDMVTFAAFDYRSGKTIELVMHDRRFVAAYSTHFLPPRLQRYRMAGIFASQGRTARLELCKQQLGEPTKQQLCKQDADDEAADETLDRIDPFDGDETDQEQQEGSYVPCQVCEQRMELRYMLEASVICPLLNIAAAAMALLHSGAAVSIHQAIELVARAGSVRSALHRSLLPGRVDTNPDLILTAQTLVQQWLAAKQETAAERGPPTKSAA